MSFPTAVNNQITDAVTQSNVKVIGEAPGHGAGLDLPDHGPLHRHPVREFGSASATAERPGPWPLPTWA